MIIQKPKVVFII